MRRAPIVVAATGAGLGLLLSYHTHPLSTSTGPKPVGVSSPPTSTTTTAPVSGPNTVAPATTTPTTQPAKTATGEDVQYQYGDIQLTVTETGSRIDNIKVASEGATDPRSQQINEQAVPLLIQEAMSAQSANIDGVSGATFTSQAFAQALQSALSQQ